MTTPHLKKSIGRSPSRLALLIPLVFACFALAQSAQAVAPQADEGDLIGNIAEEDDAVAELGSDTVKAAMGQADNTPNKREIPINIIKPLECGGTVILRGVVIVKFKAVTYPTGLRVVVPDGPLTLKNGFSGTATPGNRKLVVKGKVKPLGKVTTEDETKGDFGFYFEVTGPGLPVGQPLNFLVKYRPNRYLFKYPEVTKVFPDKQPNLQCCEGTCPPPR